jgi:hypothetical protein
MVYSAASTYTELLRLVYLDLRLSADRLAEPGFQIG